MCRALTLYILMVLTSLSACDDQVRSDNGPTTVDILNTPPDFTMSGDVQVQERVPETSPASLLGTWVSD